MSVKFLPVQKSVHWSVKITFKKAHLRNRDKNSGEKLVKSDYRVPVKSF